MNRGKVPQQEKETGTLSLIVSANTFWNIKNFRQGLVEALTKQGWEVLIAAPGVEPRWAVEHGASVAEISVDRSGLNPFRDLSLVAIYYKLMKNRRPHFFLGFTAKPNIYGSIAGRLCGVVCLPNISGLGTAFIDPGPLSALLGILYRTALARCPFIFFQNSDDRDLFVSRKIVRPEQVVLLPGSGVDLEWFKPAPKRDARTNFLFIGRLLRDKGVREFVEAARLLRSSHPHWAFQLLGPLDQDNRSAISSSELDQWVRQEVVEYLGRADDVRTHVAAATAVVLPSYREGLPRSLLEAAAMARPLIGTDVPGNRRIVDHGVNGLLCRARDAQALADAMLEMGEMDGARREAMGKCGRSLVEREFGEEKVVQAYLNAIAQLHAHGRS